MTARPGWFGPIAAIAVAPMAWGTQQSVADTGPTVDEARQETPATWAGPTTPAKAPPGIKVGIVSCGAQFRGCQAPADAAFEASKRIGWVSTMYDGAGTQEKQNAAVLDALA